MRGRSGIRKHISANLRNASRSRRSPPGRRSRPARPAVAPAGVCARPAAATFARARLARDQVEHREVRHAHGVGELGSVRDRFGRRHGLVKAAQLEAGGEQPRGPVLRPSSCAARTPRTGRRARAPREPHAARAADPACPAVRGTTSRARTSRRRTPVREDRKRSRNDAHGLRSQHVRATNRTSTTRTRSPATGRPRGSCALRRRRAARRARP